MRVSNEGVIFIISCNVGLKVVVVWGSMICSTLGWDGCSDCRGGDCCLV